MARGKPPGGWRSGPPSGSPGADTLSELYLTQELSYREIARRYGVTGTTVQRWIRAAGISPRSAGKARAVAKPWTPTDDQIAKMRDRAAYARARRTPESYKKSGETRRGQPAHNKGKPWTEETRAKHAYRQSPEYRQAASERQRGDRGNNWRGGATEEEKLRMQRWEWREARKRCYERDNYNCQDCGAKCLGGRDARRDPKRKIQAHHIIRRRDGGTDDLKNLVTLCSSCHLRREARYSGSLFA